MMRHDELGYLKVSKQESSKIRQRNQTRENVVGTVHTQRDIACWIVNKSNKLLVLKNVFTNR